ncbi:MAG: hypothetical protein HN931_14255, partial [Desulfobacterales bacterium]|nr:hypothetical protein [Desulfobacterales bacterium]
MTEKNIAKTIKIEGIVQGVGFRPFIFTLASRYNLKGEVSNTSSGVLIHIEGAEYNIEKFCKDIPLKSP